VSNLDEDGSQIGKRSKYEGPDLSGPSFAKPGKSPAMSSG